MNKVLYMTQEMEPFVPETEISEFTRVVASALHGTDYELRVFMPRYGCINERKHQLHEVIRLSGMNINVNGVQHELLVKVASLAKGKIQIYFINNEIFFSSRAVLKDDEEQYLSNNEDRAIFFARSTLETLQRLVWKPSIIHIHGWFSALLPLYIKTELKDHPFFKGIKLVYSVYPTDFTGTYSTSLDRKLSDRRIRAQHLEHLSKTGATAFDLHRLAIEYTDAVIFVEENDAALRDFALSRKKIIAEHPFAWMKKTDQLRELYGQVYAQFKTSAKTRKKTSSTSVNSLIEK